MGDSPPVVTALQSLLGSLGSIATSVFAWVVDVAEVIVDNPLLLLGIGFFVIGGAIGIFGRLLSRN